MQITRLSPHLFVAFALNSVYVFVHLRSREIRCLHRFSTNGASCLSSDFRSVFVVDKQTNTLSRHPFPRIPLRP